MTPPLPGPPSTPKHNQKASFCAIPTPCHSERSEESVLPSRTEREILRHFVPQNDREYPLALRIPPLAFRTHPLVILSTPPLVILSAAKNLFSQAEQSERFFVAMLLRMTDGMPCHSAHSPLSFCALRPCHSERSEESVLPSRTERKILRRYAPQNDRRHAMSFCALPPCHSAHSPLVILSAAKNLFSRPEQSK